MEYLILGLLLLAPMTGYQLQQFIRQNLSLICSHSAGSVQAALAKLERDGFATSTETAQGKRHKKTYSITEAGREAFSAWVARPMQAGKNKNMELARLFFLGMADPAQRTAAIRDYLEQTVRMQAMLEAIRERFRQARSGPLSPGRDWEPVFRFQGYALEYGIAAARFEQEWYTHLLTQLEEEP